MTEVIAALRNVTKAYPGTLAAQDITIEFRRGEIHAVVGENGAGKSTLVKILAGLIQPDQGHVEVRNQVCRFANPRASLLAGIGVVHQTGSLIETLTARENLELGKLYIPHKSDPRRVKQSPVLPAGVPLHCLVNKLTMRQRQLVEIYRLMLQEAELLVLDEPSAVLTRQESSLLFRDLEALAAAGHGVVVISHKLAELVSHCHTFTVLRKGQVVGRLNREDATVSKLVRLCSGPRTNEPVTTTTDSQPSCTSQPLVELRGVTTTDGEHEPLNAVDLCLRTGEILGLAGRAGSGISTLLQLLRTKRLPVTSGTIRWDQSALESFGDRTVGYVPADRVNQGVILDFSIGENLRLRRRHLLSRIGMTRRDKQRRFVDKLITRFDIRPARRDEKLRNLSGGNIQKVLLAREMDHSQMLLIVESPTAGLDIGSATFVRSLLRQEANQGACVVIHSDDFDELAELCDRVAVLVAGKVTADLSGNEISSDSIGLALSEVTFAEAQNSVVQASSLANVACAD